MISSRLGETKTYADALAALKPKDAAFVVAYLECLNGVEAVGRVWREIAARKQKAYSVMQRPGIAEAIRIGLTERRAELPFERDEIDRAAQRTARACERKPIGVQTRARVLERDGFRCRRCGHSAPDVRLVLDHIVPVVLGGDSELDNLQTLCVDCNAGKANRPPTEHDLRASM